MKVNGFSVRLTHGVGSMPCSAKASMEPIALPAPESLMNSMSAVSGGCECESTAAEAGTVHRPECASDETRELLQVGMQGAAWPALAAEG